MATFSSDTQVFPPITHLPSINHCSVGHALQPGAQLYARRDVASREVHPELYIHTVPYTLGEQSIKLLLCVDQFEYTSIQYD